MTVRSFLAEVAKTWLQRRVRRQAEKSDVLDVDEVKELPTRPQKARRTDPHKRKSPDTGNLASNMRGAEPGTGPAHSCGAVMAGGEQVTPLSVSYPLEVVTSAEKYLSSCSPHAPMSIYHAISRIRFRTRTPLTDHALQELLVDMALPRNVPIQFDLKCG